MPDGDNSHTECLFPLQAKPPTIRSDFPAVSNTQLAIHFLLQLAVILLACRVVGKVAAKLGQPQVVAEMITGVLLGPSLFGLCWPSAHAWLFPAESQRVLYPFAQAGLALYMFIVGLEFRGDIVRQRLRSMAAVSAAGMLAPFALGAALGWVFIQHTSLFTSQTGAVEGMLFLGAALCISAFPMMARVIDHRHLNSTTVGAVSLSAGAINDAAAWCLLAIVLARREGDWNRALLTIGGGLLIVPLVLKFLRPLLHRCQGWFVRNDALTPGGMLVLIALMAAGAWFTGLIGLHLVLGAFLVGAAVPRGVIVRDLVSRLKPLTVALLLPLFFTYSGMHTKMGLLNSAWLWQMCLAVLAAAIVGKGVACWLAARATGLSNREALGIGTLMNVRGLMELIIINIGLEKGIISPGLFAILVVMAIVTTVMACPVFDRLVGAGESNQSSVVSNQIIESTRHSH